MTDDDPHMMMHRRPTSVIRAMLANYHEQLMNVRVPFTNATNQTNQRVEKRRGEILAKIKPLDDELNRRMDKALDMARDALMVCEKCGAYSVTIHDMVYVAAGGDVWEPYLKCADADACEERAAVRAMIDDCAKERGVL